MSKKKEEHLPPFDPNLLEEALDGAPVGISLIDGAGTMLWANQQVEAIFGWSKAELKGQKVEILLENKLRKSHIAMREHFAKQPESRPMGLGRQLYGQNKAGQLVPLEIGINHVSIGGQSYFVTSMTDVSRANKIRDELYQAQKMEAVARMTSNIVHDFKNSLNAISGLLEIIEEVKSKLNAKQKNLFQKVTRQCQATLSLASQILSASKENPDKESIIDIAEHLKANEPLYKTLVGSGNRLILEFGEKKMHVRVDPHELNQVLLNLLVNAKDALENHGSITIALSTQHLKKTPRLTEARRFVGDYVVASVRDNGCGIPENVISTIFDPFFSTKGPDKGTGLGLSIAYEMVRKWGGFIQVESQVGKGTTFHIYLPLNEE